MSAGDEYFGVFLFFCPVQSTNPIPPVVDVGSFLDGVRDEIEEALGGFVSDIVSLVTDKHGANRYERHLHTYHMIRGNPDALLVKLCDRRHNHARSITHNERWAAMYRDEYRYFKIALWRPHQYEDLWGELDAQYEQLKRMA